MLLAACQEGKGHLAARERRIILQGRKLAPLAEPGFYCRGGQLKADSTNEGGEGGGGGAVRCRPIQPVRGGGGGAVRCRPIQLVCAVRCSPI